MRRFKHTDSCSKSLVLSMCWFILSNFDEEPPKQEDICDTAKDTKILCMYLSVL